MPTSEEVRAEYLRALARVVVSHGGVIGLRDTYYGWQDYDATTHVRRCGVAAHGEPDEDTWYEFNGTFYEDSEAMHGASMRDVTCNCGYINRRTMRVQLSPSEMAEAVFAAAYAEWCGKDNSGN